VNANESDFVLKRLSRLKIEASKCYIISENSDLDTEVLDVSAAMMQIVGYGMATILVFGNADMIYFEDEGKNNRYISKPTK
jgi:hypothetical protein